MFGIIIFSVILTSCLVAEQGYAANINETYAKEYLNHYGYWPPSNLKSNSLSSTEIEEESYEDALKQFQRRFGLTPTGLLDDPTKDKLIQPRCGVPDVGHLGGGPKWLKSNLTYSFFSYTNDLSKRDIGQAIRKAFNMWSEIIPLDFTELSDESSNADIKILFDKYDHGDPWPFDGPGGTYAHATFPKSGRLHFDDSESWVYLDSAKIESKEHIDLLNVAIHEIGHVIGIDHLKNNDALMAPYYKRTLDSYGSYVLPQLTNWDKQAAIEKYGSRSPTRQPEEAIDRVESGTLEAEFSGESFTNFKSKVISPPIYVHGMPWRISVYNYHTDECCDSLGLYLKVNEGCDEQWSVNVSATLRLHAQNSWANDVVKTYVHTFNKDSIEWGYKEFTDISNVKNSWKGYTNDDGNFKVSISFNAHTPRGKVCSKIGIITDEILDVSDLINKQENTELVSEPVYVFGMPWRMVVSSKGDDNSCCNSIGFYLQVNQECSKHWFVGATAILTIRSQKDGVEDLTNVYSHHLFKWNANNWGYKNMISHSEIRKLNSAYVKDDKVKLNIRFTAYQPTGDFCN